MPSEVQLREGAGYLRPARHLPCTCQACLDELPEGAAAEWRELVEQGEKRAMHAHLIQKAKEVGPVPSTPESLVEKVREVPLLDPLHRRSAQELLETAVVSKGALAELKRRLLGVSG